MTSLQACGQFQLFVMGSGHFNEQRFCNVYPSKRAVPEVEFGRAKQTSVIK
jgi:hypothetical protein